MIPARNRIDLKSHHEKRDMLNINKMPPVFHWTLLLIILLGWGAVSGDTDVQGTDPRVLEVLAEIEKEQETISTLQTDFVQQKKLAVFDQELIIKGSISLQKPGRLAWRVLEPMKYNMVIEEKMLRQWDESSNQVQTVSLSSNPMFGAMIQQMNEWFSGKYTAMLDQYHISLTSESPVALQFTPRETDAMFKVIEKVNIEFSDDKKQIHQISILDKTGDQTTLTFVNPRINGELDPDVWKVQP